MAKPFFSASVRRSAARTASMTAVTTAMLHTFGFTSLVSNLITAAPPHFYLLRAAAQPAASVFKAKSSGSGGLFDGEDIREASDLEDLHDAGANVDKLHPALAVHAFLRRQQHTQPRAGYILNFIKIKSYSKH